MSGNDILLYPDNIYAINLIKMLTNLILSMKKKLIDVKDFTYERMGWFKPNLNNYKEFKINEIEHELLEYKLSKEAITAK